MSSAKLSGLLALSPLVLFLLVYLASSLVAGDFYVVPVSAAFLLASVWAIIICRARGISEKIEVFSRGASNPNILLMIWIFVLAGAFAGSAKDIGAVDATVNLTLTLLPSRFLLSGLFLASCFISMSIGTSVGTIVALTPIAFGIAGEQGAVEALYVAVVIGGAFFGDNLSFISDTTIAATRTQGCSMSDKFKTNIWIALPAAIIVALIYVYLGSGSPAIAEIGPINYLKLIPYLSIIVLALFGVNVSIVLCIGLALNALLGLACGDFGWTGFLKSVGGGIAGMSDLIVVTLLAGGLLEVIRHNGGIDLLIKGLTKRIHGPRGAEASIATLTVISNLCTANNTIAILTVGDIAKGVTERYGLSPRKTASILDTFSCVVQGVIPYGAQMLMTVGLTGLSAFSIIQYLYYPLALLVVAFLAIVFRFPRK